MLTAAEELHLGQLVQAMERLKGANPDGPFTPEERQVIRAGRRAKDRMITANLRLVVAVAKKYSNSRPIQLMDAVSEGNLGLIRAVEKFDPERGYKFSTYAYWWIRQAVHRTRGHDGVLRLPEHVIAAMKKMVAISDKLREAGQPVTACTIQAHPDWVGDEALLSRATFALEAQSTMSLDAVVSRGTPGETTFVELLEAHTGQAHPELEAMQAAVARIEQTAADDLALVDLRLQGHALRDLLSVNQTQAGKLYRAALDRLQEIAGPEARAAISG